MTRIWRISLVWSLAYPLGCATTPPETPAAPVGNAAPASGTTEPGTPEPSAAPCVRAAAAVGTWEHRFRIEVGESEAEAEAGARAARETLVDLCARDRWSVGVIECFEGWREEEGRVPCQRKMTSEQRTELETLGKDISSLFGF